MKKIWIFKGERAMQINQDVEGEALKTMQKAGWTDKAPSGWKEPKPEPESGPVQTTEVEVSELNALLASNKALSDKCDALSSEVEKLKTDIATLTENRESKPVAKKAVGK